MIHRELLINGVLIGGPCDQGVGKDVAINPWDGSRVGTYAEGGWGEMAAALDAWGGRLAAGRAQVLALGQLVTV